MTTQTKVVFPGTQIGTEEEYLQGEGTYSRGGVIIATLMGAQSERDAHITNPRSPRQIRLGEPVFARVDDAFDPIMLLTVKPISNERVIYPMPSIVHVSEAAPFYVDKLRDVAKVGDIIYGEVSKVNKLGTNITLKKPDYGVVLAFCTRCKKPLKLDNSGQRPILKCTAGCNLPEGRLISPYYGNLRGILERYKVENL
ncbi:hypothetical protein COT30_02840 [Candidatus Micrarchaeota archaeon CG08_land_8_20_14_0_20_49_17]|nr:MAG: hypothetical protein AUJ13_03545 [Candidatus Micrarchaeota archaeon CG1_02_49_24]PIU09743.1 MAG: hypothetical protein COT30_02840 [Candidatus Micrarchaeota archaeon CG08_land_8_20_14_0_20_49_17]PIU81705.1 MAG: hypothetical protein COS70_02690 [Candidatus Micrarchaeota archaeon CG06_land_8_20_14_3_00_50_6]PIZ98869.1 MAG: hypothetical protein COX84_01590 [Candidatus Micrarchaeota archaeon CG_4_10_14_0_2_um_filter_49_7]HII54033.1 exosome complex RNA-binding protein Csl4 [Candidatus Micrarc